MIWATRTGPHVDRAACAWLIGRFIDREATFVFVDDPADVLAEATPFDMRGADLRAVCLPRRGRAQETSRHLERVSPTGQLLTGPTPLADHPTM